MRGELGIAPTSRPLGSFLFVGPTGVGKTELTKCFTNFLFEGPHRLIRFDMSEYQNREQLEVLFGDKNYPQGQIGRIFDLNRNNHGELQGGTIHFDEIEKAHLDIMLILLQILDDGRLTLRDGTLLDLSKFYIVMTSNIGATEAMEMRKSTPESIARVVLSLVKEKLRPELVNRITEQVVFNRLDYSVQIEIAKLLLDRKIERLNTHLNTDIRYSDCVIEQVIIEGFDTRFGARPMRRCIERLVGDAIATKLMNDEPPSGLLRSNRPMGMLEFEQETLAREVEASTIEK